MPSTHSRPSSMPFGQAASALVSNTRSVINYLSNFLPAKSQFQPKFSFSPRSGSVDIGLLESLNQSKSDSAVMSLESALQRTTDLVAASVRSSLRAFNPISPTKHDSKVLVYGTHSYYRAKYLSSIKDFPNANFLLTPQIMNLSDPSGSSGSSWGLNTDPNSPSMSSGFPGGIYWTDDESVLDEVKENSFDAVLLFNLGIESAQNTLQLLHKLERILRPGGALAGTGLFKNPSIPITASHTPSQEECLSSSCFSLRGFRDSVESIGFYMHVAIDLSMEGNVMLQVVEDIHDADGPLYLFRSGKLVCARFLATKNSFFTNHSPDSPISGSSTPPSVSTAHSNSVPTATVDLPLNLPQLDPILVTGISLGLPNSLYPGRAVFDPTNFEALFRGDNFIANLTTEEKQLILGQNVFQVYKKDGKRVKYKLHKDSECIQLSSKIGEFNISKEYPMIPAHVVETLDTTYTLAIAAGLEALKDADLDVVSSKTNDKGDVELFICGLPEECRDETGVIFASSFPCIDSIVEEASRSAAHKAREELKAELAKINEEILKSLNESASAACSVPEYEYDRKLLFKLLVMANSQLAEMIKARGPNTHINNACSGTTQALTIAEDWIRVGRCRRVIVISADNVTNPTLLPFIGSGFLALGAASINPNVTEAAVPFDLRRKGMILGSGAVGLVVECASNAIQRGLEPKVELVGSVISNSAFHATLMDAGTTSVQLVQFIDKICSQLGMDRSDLAKELIYFAHETCTSANGGCAKVELDALNAAFGPAKHDILMTNVKGYTGHPMGVGFEDPVAIASLISGRVPPLANHKVDDPALDIKPHQKPTRDNNSHSRRFVLRFAAGFGSQFVYVLYRLCDPAVVQRSRSILPLIESDQENETM